MYCGHCARRFDEKMIEKMSWSSIILVITVMTAVALCQCSENQLAHPPFLPLLYSSLVSFPFFHLFFSYLFSFLPLALLSRLIQAFSFTLILTLVAHELTTNLYSDTRL